MFNRLEGKTEEVIVLFGSVPKSKLSSVEVNRQWFELIVRKAGRSGTHTATDLVSPGFCKLLFLPISLWSPRFVVLGLADTSCLLLATISLISALRRPTTGRIGALNGEHWV